MSDHDEPPMKSGELNLEARRRLDEIIRIGRKAVHEAQEESRRLGVPNVYSINGHIYYELPNGQLSLEDPWVDDTKAKPQS